MSVNVGDTITNASHEVAAVSTIRGERSSTATNGNSLRRSPTRADDTSGSNDQDTRVPTALSAALSETQVVAVFRALKDKVVVVEGGGLTAEAREVDRKQRVLMQLKNARRLRSVLERAASEADGIPVDDARGILLRHRNDINELVSLTEAVRGNYTLDSYHQYNISTQERERERKKQIKAAKKEVWNHLREVAKERSPALFNDEECSSNAGVCEDIAATSIDEANIISGQNNQGFAVDGINKNDGEYRATYIENVIDNDDYEGESSCGSDGLAKKKQKLKKSAHGSREKTLKAKKKKTSSSKEKSKKKKKAVGVEDEAQSVIKKKKKKKSKPAGKPAQNYEFAFEQELSGQESLVTVQTESAASIPTEPAAAQTKVETVGDTCVVVPSPSPKKRRRKAAPPQPRKCHDCKVSSGLYLRCHFWFMNGTKCSKTYCMDCLSTKYGVEHYDEIKDDSEWHCPACLGTCQCKPCTKERERTERRAASNSDRRSTARTSAGFYSSF